MSIFYRHNNYVNIPFQMPRNNRNREIPANIKVAVDKIMKENFSIREAAEICQISNSKLSRHVIDARQH